jgi:hypothetical protein
MTLILVSIEHDVKEILDAFTAPEKSSDDRPQDALKIPAPKGRNLTLTENAASPFHAEPRQGASSLLRMALLVRKTFRTFTDLLKHQFKPLEFF